MNAIAIAVSQFHKGIKGIDHLIQSRFRNPKSDFALTFLNSLARPLMDRFLPPSSCLAQLYTYAKSDGAAEQRALQGSIFE